MAKRELISKEASDVQSAVNRANDLISRTMGLVHEAVRAVVEAGQQLKARRDKCEAGEWYEWLAANVKDCGRETARRWIRLAEFNETHTSRLADATSVRQAYQLAGLLPASEGGSANSCGKSTGADAYLIYLLRSETHLSAQIAAQPIEDWPTQRRTELKHRLQPFVELYQRL
jgi:hypothetical protein